MYSLYCDPSQRWNVVMRFGQCPGECMRSRTLPAPSADALLKEIHTLVADDPLEQLILVNSAHSFTLIRVLVTLYNALAFANDIQLFELPRPVEWHNLPSHLHTSHALLVPRYAHAPNITVPREQK